MATQVILLERVDNLGDLGEVVSVKPGYARNYLLPQKKALRASKENIAYFEAKKKFIEAENDKKKKDAEKLAAKLEGLKVPLIRQASESGHLYGSVTSRDIADQIAASSKLEVTRAMVVLNQNYKSLGLFPVEVALHPEVKVTVTINIARSPDEAEIQAKTGKALISEEEGPAKKPQAAAEPEAQLEGLLDEEGLENQKEMQAEAQAEAAAEAEKASTKKPKKAKAKKAESAEAEDEAEDEAD